MKHKVFLIPGFFGFTRLGDFTYWGHTRGYLESLLRQRGVDAEVICVSTLPTASIRDRAREVLTDIQQVVGREDDVAIHLIGHSTGALDARLLTTPSVSLRGSIASEPWMSRVKTVVSVSGGHHGVPMASFFSGLMGQKILQVLSLATVYIVHFGHLPLSGLVRLVGLLSVVDGPLNMRKTVLKQLRRQLLADFNAERRGQLKDFFSSVEDDQSLLFQLTQEGMDLFNAAVVEREGVRYGSVLTRAPKPGIRSSVGIGLDPYAQAMHTLYHVMHRLADELNPALVPTLTEAQRRAVIEAYGTEPSMDDNDGVVPTLSQVYGEVIHAAEADHLDVIGHFEDPKHHPPHYDWIVAHAGFARPQFEAVWEDVVDFMLLEEEE